MTIPPKKSWVYLWSVCAGESLHALHFVHKLKTHSKSSSSMLGQMLRLCCNLLTVRPQSGLKLFWISVHFNARLLRYTPTLVSFEIMVIFWRFFNTRSHIMWSSILHRDDVSWVHYSLSNINWWIYMCMCKPVCRMISKQSENIHWRLLI